MGYKINYIINKLVIVLLVFIFHYLYSGNILKKYQNYHHSNTETTGNIY